MQLRKFASTLVRQWWLKRVLMRPEAAFPYVSAVEGAQHPPKMGVRNVSDMIRKATELGLI